MAQDEYPRLREGLEAHPVEYSGQKMVLLRDRVGFSEGQLVLSPHAVPFLLAMDGTRTLTDILAEYAKQTGHTLEEEQLTGLVRVLDENNFLENEKFRSMAAEKVSSFLRSTLRKPYHAGRSYPHEAAELKAMLESFYAPERGGPGMPDARRPKSRRLLGLVAPHIDLNSGGPCFAHAYRALSESQAPRTWIVLGTGHEPVENCFAMARKDFETPLGTVRCDTELCDRIAAAAGRDVFASEYNHRTEHTIEFQSVFLALTQPDALIVPILCSFGAENWASCKNYVDAFAHQLRECVLSDNGSVGILASIDLAHVGPRYGDQFKPDPATIFSNMEDDSTLLDLLRQCKADEFIDRIHADGNSRKICGVAPLYVLAKALEGKAAGATLCHSYAPVDDENSFVTFASMAFHAC